MTDWVNSWEGNIKIINKSNNIKVKIKNFLKFPIFIEVFWNHD